jgi:hypothetical protein
MALPVPDARLLQGHEDGSHREPPLDRIPEVLGHPVQRLAGIFQLAAPDLDLGLMDGHPWVSGHRRPQRTQDVHGPFEIPVIEGGRCKLGQQGHRTGGDLQPSLQSVDLAAEVPVLAEGHAEMQPRLRIRRRLLDGLSGLIDRHVEQASIQKRANGVGPVICRWRAHDASLWRFPR